MADALCDQVPPRPESKPNCEEEYTRRLKPQSARRRLPNSLIERPPEFLSVPLLVGVTSLALSRFLFYPAS